MSETKSLLLTPSPFCTLFAKRRLHLTVNLLHAYVSLFLLMTCKTTLVPVIKHNMTIIIANPNRDWEDWMTECNKSLLKTLLLFFKMLDWMSEMIVSTKCVIFYLHGLNMMFNKWMYSSLWLWLGVMSTHRSFKRTVAN